MAGTEIRVVAEKQADLDIAHGVEAEKDEDYQKAKEYEELEKS